MEIGTTIGIVAGATTVGMLALYHHRLRVAARTGALPQVDRPSGENACLSADEADFILRLNSLTEIALDQKDLPGLIQALADSMAGIISADGCHITFWDEERRLTVPVAAYGPYRSTFADFQVEPDESSFTAAIAKAGHSLAIEDTRASPIASRRIAESFPARSLLGIPMISDGRILGAVIIGFSEPHSFTDAEKAQCEHATKHISFAVSKMRLLEDERRRAEELAALNNIGMAINSGREFNEVVTTIFEQCRGIIDLDTFYLALYDEEREELSFPLFYDGGELIAFETRNLRDRPGMSGHIIKTRKALCIPDASLPEVQSGFGIVRAGGAPSKSYIGVPLLHGDHVLGVLSVQNRQAHAYSSRQVQLVETIAAQSAIALENARLYDELRHLSVTDGLTGIFNFRSLMELGPMELARAARLGRHLSLVFFDIDLFKDFNDSYGHATGNTVLMAVVERARSCIRGIDLFARFGGEEFVIVLPETPLDEAIAVAERVRAAVESLEVSVPGISGELRVTISAGVASMDSGSKDFQDVLDRANTAERAAKELGRNRVEVAR